MLKRIAWIVVIVLIGVAVWYGYNRWKATGQNTDGAVVCVQNCDTPEQKAAFSKLNSGDTADGQSERKEHTASEDNAALAAGFPAGTVAQPANAQPGQGYGNNQVVPNVVPEGQKPQTGGKFGAYGLGNNSLSSSPESGMASTGTFSRPAQPAVAPATMAVGPAGLPLTDSRAPNAPNDLHFSGSGNYQWYRQGNLTWRVNTASGRSCIIYATMEEWQKQNVMSHGCGRTA